ncbi:MAG TPA: GTPase Era [Fimbriimonadaceae bacterium]|nr:GTPase Era [Fimbriimonadaceae bacterium]
MSFRSGVVAIVGRPNVGKSTLINHVVGQKVTIVSDKAQTTRRRTVAIATTDDWQIVFVDTPGVHTPRHRLGKALNETAKQSVRDVDLLLVMVDASKPPSKDDQDLAAMLRDTGALTEGNKDRAVLCMNKMDLLKAEDVEERYKAYTSLFQCGSEMMTSLKKGQNVDLLVGLLVEHLPEGEPHYDPGMVTDQPMSVLASELVREKALMLTREEVPHSLATYTESWEEENGIAYITVVILVERAGQKAIVIGKKGAMLTKIGSEARKEIEQMLGQKVFLELFVKVRSEWRQNATILRELDYL